MHTLTSITLEDGSKQPIFEVYANESREQTLGFVYDEKCAALVAAAPGLLKAAEWSLEELCKIARANTTDCEATLEYVITQAKGAQS